MNKTILLTLAILVGVSCSDAIAKSKKNDKKIEVTKLPVDLQSSKDSLSYTAGQSRTRGLMEYVQNQLKVDSANMQYFIKGLEDGIAVPDTPEAKARLAGQYVAFMVAGQMAPQLVEQLTDLNAEFNTELFKRGFLDAVQKDASVLSVDESADYFNKQMKVLSDAAIEAKKAAGVKWLAENKLKEGVKTTPSGLQYRVIREGNGIVATKNADVEVKYEGQLIDGTVFDSSYKRSPQTTTFKPSQVISGWTEALCMMPEGSEWELYIPENLAYGGRKTGSIPEYSTLIFKVEVVKVTPEATEEPAADKEPVKTTTKATAKKTTVRKPVAKKK